MQRKPFALLILRAFLALATVVVPALPVAAACTAGNPNASVVETTPSADFADNGDGTATHGRTGLTWKQCAEGQSGPACATGAPTAMDWANALNAANAANSASAGLGFAGHSDWRLPSKRELQSIVEFCGYIPAINQVVFPATPALYFWSGSSRPGDAWIVSFYDGRTGADNKESHYYVRLVRGGQSLDSFDRFAGLYGVTYSGNGSTGGSVPVDAGAYAPGATVTVLANTGSLTRTGHTFAGWNTAANGSGTDYAATGSATFAMPASNVTLYAKWTLITYSVTYNGNGNTGGTAPTDANAYAPGATVTVLANTGSLTRAGYTFVGWNTAADGSGTNYAASGSATVAMPASNVTLYAKWTLITYSVTYNGNGNTGGTAPTDANAYAPGATVTVLANTGNLMKTGYTFAGWNTAANGSGTSYAATGSATFAMPAANVTLYAQWTVVATPPTVQSLVRVHPSPTMADSVSYTLTFSEPVTAPVASNFSIATTGILTAAGVGTISGVGIVSGRAATWTVTVNTGRGTGTLQLKVANGTGIVNVSSVALAGTLPFNGEIYSIDKGGTVLGGGVHGQPDNTFGSNGYALFNATQGVASPGAVVVLANTKILAAGGIACDVPTGTNCTLQLAQYMANGTPDAGFGTAGRVTTAVTGINPELAAIIVNGDGSFFVAGSRASGANTVPFVAKFGTTGAPVAAFGTSGVANLGSLTLGSAITGTAVDGNGRVMIAGTRPSAVPQGTDLFVARLTTAGALDGGFGSGGVASFGLSAVGNRDDYASDVVVQSNGRILVGGRTMGASGFDFLVMRLNGNGGRDNSFGTSGVVTTHFAGSTGNNDGRKLALQPDGRIVLVGPVQVGADSRCGVARFESDGTPDTSFGTNGQTLIPLTQGCLAVALESDGKLVVTALDRNPDVNYATYARVLANGAPDMGFGTDGVQDISSYGPATEAAVTTGGKLVSGLVIQDAGDGIRKSYVVELTGALGIATTTAITSITPSPALTGQAYSVAVKVTAASGTPGGTVYVSDGTGASCVATLAAGVGSCAIVSTTDGGKTVAASYGGATGFAPSSTTKAQTINAAGTATALTASATTVQVGTQITFTATVTATSAGATTPTGTVAFKDGAKTLATVPLNGVGVASVSLTLASDTYNVTAHYTAADANYFKNSKSAALAIDVQALPTVQFAATALAVDETAGTILLVVKHSGSVLGPVTVKYDSADGSAAAPGDYGAVHGTLSWAAGDGADKTIAITVVKDGLAEPDEKFTVTLSVPSGATLGKNVTETVTIRKN